MKPKTIYSTMLGSMFLRLFWLTGFEPRGAKLAVLNNPDNSVVHTLPYVVYPSIVILIGIIIFTILKKPWAYMAGLVFGVLHIVLIMPLVVLKLHPGFGPLVVVPTCVLMIIFSYLAFKKRDQI